MRSRFWIYFETRANGTGVWFCGKKEGQSLRGGFFTLFFFFFCLNNWKKRIDTEIGKTSGKFVGWERKWWWQGRSVVQF